MAWIDWLGGWLKSIVLIVLVATFIDLLLPNQTMQRYVRTVISLFLLMTLLTPIFQLFQKNWDLHQLLYEAEAAQHSLMNPAATRGNGTFGFQDIMGEGEKLKENALQQAKQLLEEQSSKWIKAEIEHRHGRMVKEVRVKADVDSSGEASVRHVAVNLSYDEAMIAIQEQSDSEQAGNAQPVAPRGISAIEPIQPVQIEIGRIDVAAEDRSAVPTMKNTSLSIEPLIEQIQQMIHQNLQIPIGQIIVSFW